MQVQTLCALHLTHDKEAGALTLWLKHNAPAGTQIWHAEERACLQWCMSMPGAPGKRFQTHQALQRPAMTCKFLC